MHDWITSLLTKAGLSLLSATALFLAGRFWKSLLRPWIESLWYSGIRLAPHYLGEFVFEGATQHDLIEVKQKASRLWGTMTFPGGRQGLYRFEAVVLDNVIRGTYEGERINPQSRGSFLLALTPGNAEFEGWFVEPYQGKVIALAYKWTPKYS